MSTDSLDGIQERADPEMLRVLDDLLTRDVNITARAVARLHSGISAASSVTRSKERSRLLSQYQERQAEFRKWRGRPGKLASTEAAAALADRDLYIAKLESQVALLTASHVALLRAVGELGGYTRWSSFYNEYRESREQLAKLGALPVAQVSSIQSRSSEG
ncbi:hypothetical protein [Stenotrophomonas maltophilia]|uniref:hypothetical protein n=1 Tax=Stenotrophomonas maltophilia TaxID=40324 RepID=UPI0009B2A7AC|nr:hypothetical protein [Stenotrophomonas maltophilia]